MEGALDSGVVIASSYAEPRRNLDTPVRVPLSGGAPIVEGTFVARPNRFVIEARLASGEHVRTHCADRGRLLWLTPGMPLLIGVKSGAMRKTGFQSAAVWHDGAWASLDTHLPNRLIETAFRQRALAPFAACDDVRREVRIGASRIDFRLSDGDRACYVEVKSVGNAIGEIGLFPDAPTERGRRHLDELAALARSGTRTAVIFVAQHATARSVAADPTIDPAFADALRAARDSGVEVYAYGCAIDHDGIVLRDELPCVI